jgi:hypothetical protein
VVNVSISRRIKGEEIQEDRNEKATDPFIGVRAKTKAPGFSLEPNRSFAIVRTQSDTPCHIQSNSAQDELPVKAGIGYISKSL